MDYFFAQPIGQNIHKQNEKFWLGSILIKNAFDLVTYERMWKIA